MLWPQHCFGRGVMLFSPKLLVTVPVLDNDVGDVSVFHNIKSRSGKSIVVS
jgi:hypothetical protein